jgi:hypothetical protein
VVSRTTDTIPLFARSTSRERVRTRGVRWLTWSEEFRTFVVNHASELRVLSRPRLIEVRGCEPYQWTYDASIGQLDWLDGRTRRSLARVLTKVTPGHDLWVLDRLIDDQIDSRMLLALFVLFRACLVDQADDPSRAMCRPVPRASHDRGFPLHADLFVHQKLMLAFDDVAAEGGASLFLPVESLIRLLRGNPKCPVGIQRRIVSLLTRRHRVDRFDELFDLLHERKYPWVPALQRGMARAQILLQLRQGQGYLIDDRHWLHGRSPSTIPVTTRRFRRLAF